MRRFPVDFDEFQPPNVCFIAAAIIGAGALGAGASIYGATEAAGAQTNAANKAISAQESMFNQGLNEVQPYVNAGQTAENTLLSLITPGPNQTSTLNQTPGFQFAQDWGLKGINNAATTSGLGGNVLTAADQFATGTAENTFSTIAQLLQGVTSTGAGAAGSALSGSVTTGGNLASLTSNIGNAQAGAAVGTANAVGGLGQSISTAALLNKLYPSSSATATNPGLGYSSSMNYSPVNAAPGSYVSDNAIA